ncbi:MAG: ankyrin repeat domain-containing protein [Ruminococcus sp.]|nr:ankyrin repeat domain-containing protein [Ruminococcus sp.]
MKAMVCEMCNSNDMLKQDGMFVCQSCGTKYSVEEAKKLMVEGTVDVQGTVKVDNSAFVEKYLINARRAKQKEDWKETEKYYNLVEQNDPTNIEAIFYSSFARVKTALLEPETKDKRQSVFNVLVKSVSVIDDNYDVTNEEHQKLLFEILEDIKGLEDGSIVPTTHLQDYVTKNGYLEIVDRSQVVENDSLDVTYNMIDKVLEAYVKSFNNIAKMQCEYLSQEEFLKKALESVQNGYRHVALGYFSAYIKKHTNSPIGYVGEAWAFCAARTPEGEKKALEYLRKAAQYKAFDNEEKDNLKFLINRNVDDGITLLMAASNRCDYEVAKYLVESGADINTKSDYNTTALWYVCSKTHQASDISAAINIAKLLLDAGADANVTSLTGVATLNCLTHSAIASMIKSKYPNLQQPKGSGCYVATVVYGSYDCAEVWTLRRFRDDTLASTWYGRAFIKTYYAISPTLVKWFGDTQWFKNMWKPTLDKMVRNLNNKGVENTPYNDREW